MSLKRAAFLAVFVLLAAAAFFIFRPETEDAPEAFGKARWGMTPGEVEIANGVKLEDASGRRKFFTPAEGQDPMDYQVFEQPPFLFLEHEARASYVFLSDRLVAYHVYLQSSEGVRLDRESRQYLTARFGDGYSMTENEADPLKMVWQGRDLIVNYWFFEDPLALRQKYRAVFGARNPRLESVKAGQSG